MRMTTKRSKGIQKLVMALMLFLCILVLPVNAKAAAPKLTKKQVTLTVGKSTTLTVKNAKGKVRWKSSRSSVASVKKTGAKKAKITAKKAGTAKITAKVGKKKLTCKVTVKKAGTSTAKNTTAGSAGDDAVPALKKIASGTGYVRIYWKAVEDATGYEVLRKGAGDNSWTGIATVKGNVLGYLDQNVKAGETYSYTVRSIKGKKKSSYDEQGLTAKVPEETKQESTKEENKENTGTQSGGGNSGSQSGETESAGENVIVTRSSLKVGLLDFCNAGDYDSFFPRFVMPALNAEQGNVWIAALSEEERAYTEQQITNSTYPQEFKEELIRVLNGEVILDDTYKAELYDSCGNYLSSHCFAENHGRTSTESVYYYGPWVEILESEYDAWAAINIR
jgi:hypothetical protein